MTHPLEATWTEIEEAVINNIKFHLLSHYITQILTYFEPSINIVVKSYLRQLPYHVANSEGEDLHSLAQLEFIESIKAWDPKKADSIWALGKLRVVGAMKDHIRYVTKSDPTRLYDWMADAAYMVEVTENLGNFNEDVENSMTLNRLMEVLSLRERKIVIAHAKKDLTFKEIGDKIDVSESQVSRIYKKAIQKMQKAVKKSG